MQLLSTQDLRLVTKILQMLRKDHGIRISHGNRELLTKVQSAVDEVQDAAIDILWQQISAENIQIPAAKKQQKVAINPDETYIQF